MKYYRNYSIQGKIISALIICILLPMFFASYYISSYIVNLNKESQYSYDLNLLQQLSEDINEVTKNNMQFVYSVINNVHIKAIVRGDAGVMDYKKADEFLMSNINKASYYEAIMVSKGEEVKFQRGKKYFGEKEEIDYINKVMTGNKESGFWAEPHSLIVYDGCKKYPRTVISFYTVLYDFFTMEPIGTIGAHINEKELAKTYTNYLEGKSLEAMIINDQGVILSSNSKSMIGKKSELFETMLEKRKLSDEDAHKGYLNVKYQGGSATLFYVKSQENGWYILNILPRYSLLKSAIGYALTGIIISILFGFTYGFIQRRYIIKPLQLLSARMDEVKRGNMEVEKIPPSEDEIGVIIKNFEEMLSQINFWINQVYLEKIKTQEAERDALLAQMKPHFLYNTLDSIHWLALRNKDYEVSNQLEALSEVFKHVLNFGNQMITIGGEVEFINNYVYLMKARFHGRFEVLIEVDEELYPYEIPKLVVQPLVENAIVHGLERKENGGKVKVKIQKRRNRLRIVVIDNGVGCDQRSIQEEMQKKNQLEKIFALVTINERIKLRYGNEFELYFYSKINQGSVVKITMPCGEGENNALNDCG